MSSTKEILKEHSIQLQSLRDGQRANSAILEKILEHLKAAPVSPKTKKGYKKDGVTPRKVQKTGGFTHWAKAKLTIRESQVA